MSTGGSSTGPTTIGLSGQPVQLPYSLQDNPHVLQTRKGPLFLILIPATELGNLEAFDHVSGWTDRDQDILIVRTKRTAAMPAAPPVATPPAAPAGPTPQA